MEAVMTDSIRNRFLIVFMTFTFCKLNTRVDELTLYLLLG